MNELSNKLSKTSGRLLAGVLSLGVLIWGSLNVWTAPAGVLWHLFHGDVASFNGIKFHVPWDMWIHRSSDQSLMIVRESPRFPIGLSPAGSIIIQHAPGPPTDMLKNYDRIAKANEHERTGYTFRGIREIKAAKGHGYCWEFVRLDFLRLSISCLFDKDALAAAYEGSPDYREEFYDVVGTISGAPAGGR